MVEHGHSDSIAPSRVVVLGASGFLGRDLVRRLETHGIPVLGLSSADADLTDISSVKTMSGLVKPGDALVFASALTPDKGRDIRTMMRNMAMGEHVSALLDKSDFSHVVYISSDAVYADDVALAREDSRCEPSNYYGLMHVVRERMMLDTLAAQGTPLLILRPTLLYGPEDTHNSYGPNRYFRMAADDGKITLFGQGEEKRDHVYIEDVSRLITDVLERKSAGTLNLASGTSVPFMEAANIVAGLVGPSVEIAGLPRQMPITHRHFDTTALVKAFPAFRFTPLADGLKATWETKNGD